MSNNEGNEKHGIQPLSYRRYLSVISDSKKIAAQQYFGCFLFFIFVGIVAFLTKYTQRRRERERNLKIGKAVKKVPDKEDEAEADTVASDLDDTDGSSSDEDLPDYYPRNGFTKDAQYVRILQDCDEEYNVS